MNAEIFAEWLEMQGLSTYRTHSTYWCEVSPKVFQAFPYHWIIQPSESEVNEFIHSKQAIALRFCTPVSCPGMISYHIVFQGNDYSLEKLDRRTRQNIRKGLKNCTIEKIPFSKFADEGWFLEEDTIIRQGRDVNLEKQKWHTKIMAAAELPGFEAWGAYIDSNLAASILSFQMDDCCELITQQCYSEFLKYRVNNALIYHVTNEMVNRSEINRIFYTMQSLDAPESVDEFKIRMGYTALPVKQRIVFHPWLSPLIKRPTKWLASSLIRIQPTNANFTKFEGMIKFYSEGEKPDTEQIWPSFLKS